jgi:hypothetical protein
VLTIRAVRSCPRTRSLRELRSPSSDDLQSALTCTTSPARPTQPEQATSRPARARRPQVVADRLDALVLTPALQKQSANISIDFEP